MTADPASSRAGRKAFNDRTNSPGAGGTAKPAPLTSPGDPLRTAPTVPSPGSHPSLPSHPQQPLEAAEAAAAAAAADGGCHSPTGGSSSSSSSSSSTNNNNSSSNSASASSGAYPQPALCSPASSSEVQQQQQQQQQQQRALVATAPAPGASLRTLLPTPCLMDCWNEAAPQHLPVCSPAGSLSGSPAAPPALKPGSSPQQLSATAGNSGAAAALPGSGLSTALPSPQSSDPLSTSSTSHLAPPSSPPPPPFWLLEPAAADAQPPPQMPPQPSATQLGLSQHAPSHINAAAAAAPAAAAAAPVNDGASTPRSTGPLRAVMGGPAAPPAFAPPPAAAAAFAAAAAAAQPALDSVQSKSHSATVAALHHVHGMLLSLLISKVASTAEQGGANAVATRTLDAARREHEALGCALAATWHKCGVLTGERPASPSRQAQLSQSLGGARSLLGLLHLLAHDVEECGIACLPPASPAAVSGAAQACTALGDLCASVSAGNVTCAALSAALAALGDPAQWAAAQWADTANDVHELMLQLTAAQEAAAAQHGRADLAEADAAAGRQELSRLQVQQAVDSAAAALVGQQAADLCRQVAQLQAQLGQQAAGAAAAAVETAQHAAEVDARLADAAAAVQEAQDEVGRVRDCGAAAVTPAACEHADAVVKVEQQAADLRAELVVARADAVAAEGAPGQAHASTADAEQRCAEQAAAMHELLQTVEAAQAATQLERRHAAALGDELIRAQLDASVASAAAARLNSQLEALTAAAAAAAHGAEAHAAESAEACAAAQQAAALLSSQLGDAHNEAALLSSQLAARCAEAASARESSALELLTVKQQGAAVLQEQAAAAAAQHTVLEGRTATLGAELQQAAAAAAGTAQQQATQLGAAVAQRDDLAGEVHALRQQLAAALADADVRQAAGQAQLQEAQADAVKWCGDAADARAALAALQLAAGDAAEQRAAGYAAAIARDNAFHAAAAAQQQQLQEQVAVLRAQLTAAGDAAALAAQGAAAAGEATEMFMARVGRDNDLLKAALALAQQHVADLRAQVALAQQDRDGSDAEQQELREQATLALGAVAGLQHAVEVAQGAAAGAVTQAAVSDARIAVLEASERRLLRTVDEQEERARVRQLAAATEREDAAAAARLQSQQLAAQVELLERQAVAAAAAEAELCTAELAVERKRGREVEEGLAEHLRGWQTAAGGWQRRAEELHGSVDELRQHYGGDAAALREALDAAQAARAAAAAAEETAAAAVWDCGVLQAQLHSLEGDLEAVEARERRSQARCAEVELRSQELEGLFEDLTTRTLQSVGISNARRDALVEFIAALADAGGHGERLLARYAEAVRLLVDTQRILHTALKALDVRGTQLLELEGERDDLQEQVDALQAAPGFWAVIWAQALLAWAQRHIHAICSLLPALVLTYALCGYLSRASQG